MMKWLGTHEKAETFLSQHAWNMKQKALKKKRYDLLIESIDARVWIDDINDANEKGKAWFDKKIRIRKDGISLDDTWGLKLWFNKNIWRYQIKDFSTWTRYGNKKFLFNHYFWFSWLNKSQRKSKALSYVDFISKYFWIHPNASLTKVAISEKVVHDFIKDKMHIDMDGIVEDVKKWVFDNGKVKFDDKWVSRCDWFRIYFLLNSFIQTNDITHDEMWNFELDYDEFFEFAWFSSGNFENKKYVNTILAYLNRIYVIHTYWKTQKIRYVAKNNVVGKKIYVCLDTEIIKAWKTPKTKIVYFPATLGIFATKKTDNRRTKFLTEILYWISSFKSVKIKLGEDQNHWYGINSAIRILSQMRENKIIADFLIRKNYAYIGEKKYLQSLWKRKTSRYRKKKIVKE